MPTCKYCACEIAENSRFCSQCGKPVERVRPAAPGASPPAVPEKAAAAENLSKSRAKPENPAPEAKPAPAPKAARKPSDYCKKCGARLPASCVFCLICGTKAGEEPPPPEPAVTSTFELPSMPGVAVRRAERKSSRLTTVCVFLSVLLALTAAGMWLAEILPYLSAANRAKARGALVYIVNGQSLRFKTPLMDEPEEVESFLNTGQADGNIARTSPNGQYMAYLKDYKPPFGIFTSDPSTLYLRDFAKIPKRDSSEPLSTPIADGVTDSFFFTDNNLALVYLKSDSTLEYTDFTESRHIDGEVFEIISHIDSLVLYSKQITSYSFDLYLASVQEGAEFARKIAEDVIELCDYTPSLDKFVYIRRNADGTSDVIGCDAKQDSNKTLIVGMPGDIVEADARTFSVLFQTSAPNPFRYDSVIDDDMLREDLRTAEPDLEDYPLLNEFYDKYGVDADYKGSLNYEEIVDEKGRFEAALIAYEQKLARDKLRDDITAAVETFTEETPLLYSLYLCLNGDIAKLADSSYTPFDNATLDADKSFVIWPYADMRGLKRIPISEYERVVGSGTLLQYLYGRLGQNLYLQRFGHNAVPLDIGEGPFYLSGWRLTEKADGVYFSAGEGCPVQSHDLNACSLYYAPLENGAAGGISLADENVFGVGPMLYGDRLLYYKGMNGGLCDLYLIEKNGVGERIGDNVSVSEDYLKIENDGKTLFYFEHFNKALQSGDLFMLTRQNRQLASDVYGVYYRTDTLVYFLRGLKDGKADLYSFGDDGLRLVDSNVTAVIE